MIVTDQFTRESRARRADKTRLRHPPAQRVAAFALGDWMRILQHGTRVCLRWRMAQGVLSAPRTMVAESAGELGLAPGGMCLAGVLLLTSQAVFAAQRGLDPQMDDGLWLSEVDFALRARETGVAIAAMGGAVAYAPPSGLPDMAARAKFKVTH